MSDEIAGWIKEERKMKVRITEFSERDSARGTRRVGEVGEGKIESWTDGWSYCHSFTFEDGDVWPLFEFKYEPVEQRKSWLQKIRDYDRLVIDRNETVDSFDKLSQKYMDIYARCNLAEAMRDHYKQVAETALWNSATNGRRLKFSVGHSHFEIIVGNPVTYIHNFNKTTEDKNGFNSDIQFSVCNPKDTYNWKAGVIQSVENLCNEWDYSKELRTQIFDKLFSKYPELRMK